MRKNILFSTILFISIFIYESNFVFCFDFNLAKISTPLGDNNSLGKTRVFSNNFIVLTQKMDDVQRVFLSKDNGITWFTNNTSKYLLPINNTYFHISTHDILYAAPSYIIYVDEYGYRNKFEGAFYSLDFGITWNDCGGSAPIYSLIGGAKIISNNDSIVWYKDNELFCTSNHYGFSLGSEGGGAFPAFFSNKYNNSSYWEEPSLYSNKLQNLFYKFKNFFIDVLNFDNLSFVPPTPLFSQLEVNEQQDFIGFGADSVRGSGIFKSNDECINWKLVKSLPEKDSVFQIEFYKDYVFAPSVKGLLYSSNRGEDWQYASLPINTDSNAIVGWVSINKDGDIFVISGCCNLLKGHITTSDVSEPINEDIISISPNPAESYIYINLPPEFLTEKIKIYSVEGIEMYNSFCRGTGMPVPYSGNIKIDVSNFSPGVYYVKAGDRVSRFVKI